MLRLPRSLAGESPGPLSMTRLMKGQIKLHHYPVEGRSVPAIGKKV